MIKMEQCKFYLDSNGEEHGPMEMYGATDRYCWTHQDAGWAWWDNEGRAQEGTNAVELVGEIHKKWFLDTTNSPVRTETITRTIIEPGVYGRLRVKPTKGPHVQVKLVTIHGNEITEAALNATELRELARIATELADGLDAQ